MAQGCCASQPKCSRRPGGLGLTCVTCTRSPRSSVSGGWDGNQDARIQMRGDESRAATVLCPGGETREAVAMGLGRFGGHPRVVRKSPVSARTGVLPFPESGWRASELVLGIGICACAVSQEANSQQAAALETQGQGWGRRGAHEQKGLDGRVGSGQEELPRRGESAEGGVEPETRRFPEAEGRDLGRRVWSGRRPQPGCTWPLQRSTGAVSGTGRRTRPEADRPLVKWGPPAPELEDRPVGRFRWKR